MALKYHKIFTHDHLNARELSEVYTSDSDDHGRLFIILELPKHNKINQQPYVDEIINQAAAYFDTAGADDPEVILEELLQKINQILPELNSSLKIRGWVSTLDLAIGIMHQNNVYLASIGNINGILIHNNQISEILTKNTNVNPTKAFVDIVSGQLDDGDALIVSTNSLFDYISKEKIKQIVKKYPPSAAAIKLNELLETVPEFVSFNSLIVKKPGITEQEIKPIDIESGKQLEMAVRSDTIEVAKTEKKSQKHPRAKTKLVLDPKGFQNIKIFQKMQKVLSLAKIFFVIVAGIFIYIFQKIKAGILFLTSPNYRKNKEEKTIDNIKEITDKKYFWFKNLSIKKKAAVVILFIVLLFFVQSLVFLTQQKADEDKDRVFNEAVATISSKYSEVESKLIYNDEQSAEKILLEIDQIVKNLKATSPQQEEELDKMREKVFRELNKVRHIHVVPAPLELVDMTSTVSSAKDIVQKQGTFYILADNKLFELKDENLNQIVDFAESGQTVISMTNWPETDKMVLNTKKENNDTHYQIFNIKQSNITGDLKQSVENTSVKDLAIYGDNLYVLDPENNQIFKYPESGNSFSGGTRWIKEELDISDASSLAIDGSIYIIENNGKIKNLLKGETEPFDYHQPNPLIGPSSKIKTFRESDYLYIIDPQNYRIIILDKEGNIKDQYTSMKFDNLLDLTVDPDEKAIYLLNGNHLYLLAINQ